MNKLALVVEAEKPVKVTYDGAVIGDFFVDLLVNQQIIIELKAVQNLAVAHEVQLVNYLTATGFDIGLLINFGAERLEFKRKHRKYREKAVPNYREALTLIDNASEPGFA